MAAGEDGHLWCICLGRTLRDPACRLTVKATRADANLAAPEQVAVDRL